MDYLVWLIGGSVLGFVGGFFARHILIRKDSDVTDAYLRGLREAAPAMQLIPFVHKESTYLGMKKLIKIGYRERLFYRGVPIGEPKEIVTQSSDVWDESRVDQALQLAQQAAQFALQGALQRGLSGSIEAPQLTSD